MEDEVEQPEVDRWIATAAAPDAQTIHRVVARSLDLPSLERPPRRIRWVTAALSAAGVLSVLFAGVVVARKARPEPAAPLMITVTREGPVLVVRSGDGRRWIVGPRIERPSGDRSNYAIVVPADPGESAGSARAEETR